MNAVGRTSVKCISLSLIFLTRPDSERTPCGFICPLTKNRQIFTENLKCDALQNGEKKGAEYSVLSKEFFNSVLQDDENRS